MLGKLKVKKSGLSRKVHTKDTWLLLIIALPGLLHFLVFKYIPLFGNAIAFQDYNIFRGFMDSQWVGFKHFLFMFQHDDFRIVFWNSFKLGMYTIIWGFPAPLLLALLLNEVRFGWLKRPVQTILYLPHFLSWVIVGGIFINILAINGGVNTLLHQWFGIEPTYFLGVSSYFRTILVGTGVWKEMGWGMIIFLAALAGINPQLYEAATVDGAGRWKKMWYITLPCILPAIMILLMLNIAKLMDANVEQVLIFLNPLVRDVGEVFDTYIYRVGLVGGQFSYTTAIGIFKALIGFVLVVGLNQLSKRTTGESIY